MTAFFPHLLHPATVFFPLLIYLFQWKDCTEHENCKCRKFPLKLHEWPLNPHKQVLSKLRHLPIRIKVTPAKQAILVFILWLPLILLHSIPMSANMVPKKPSDSRDHQPPARLDVACHSFTSIERFSEVDPSMHEAWNPTSREQVKLFSSTQRLYSDRPALAEATLPSLMWLNDKLLTPETSQRSSGNFPPQLSNSREPRLEHVWRYVYCSKLA